MSNVPNAHLVEVRKLNYSTAEHEIHIIHSLGKATEVQSGEFWRRGAMLVYQCLCRYSVNV